MYIIDKKLTIINTLFKEKDKAHNLPIPIYSYAEYTNVTESYEYLADILANNDIYEIDNLFNLLELLEAKREAITNEVGNKNKDLDFYSRLLTIINNDVDKISSINNKIREYVEE